MVMNTALVLDLVIACLLFVTIIYCAILLQKLRSLRGTQSELRGVINDFGEAIIKAEQGVIELRKAGSGAAKVLDEKINNRQRDLIAEIAKAAELANDLEFMTASGHKLADRLEASISTARVAQSEKVVVPVASVAVASKHSTGELTSMDPPHSKPPITSPTPISIDSKESVTPERADQDNDDADDLNGLADDKNFGRRSQVERDLLQALRQTK